MSPSQPSLRDGILMLELFRPCSSMGYPPEGMLLESEILQTYSIDEIASEVEAMERDGLVQKNELDSSKPSAEASWFSTRSGQILREERLRALGHRAEVLVNQRDYLAEDLVLALATNNRLSSPSDISGETMLQRVVEIYLSELRSESLDSAISNLATRGLIHVVDLHLGSGPQLGATGTGLQHYKQSVAPRLGLDPSKPILAPPERSDTRFRDLGLDEDLAENLRTRWREATACFESEAHIAALTMLGSVLEGALYAQLYTLGNRALNASSAPMNRSNDGSQTPKPLEQWKLVEMIRVAGSLNMLDLTITRHADAVRDSRNLVHPQKQLQDGIIPDAKHVRIALEVVDAAIDSLVSYANTTGEE